MKGRGFSRGIPQTDATERVPPKPFNGRLLRETSERYELLLYRVDYSPDVEDHLGALTARQQGIVLDAVEEQLVHQPTVETRNRRPMRPNPVAPWELRIGNLRVYYDVEDDPEPVVFIRAVGVKQRNRVRIGREVIEL